MENFFTKPKLILSQLKKLDFKNLDRDALIFKIMPHFLMEIVKNYLRLEVVGAENLPKDGLFLFVPIHSVFSGFDVLVL